MKHSAFHSSFIATYSVLTTTPSETLIFYCSFQHFSLIAEGTQTHLILRLLNLNLNMTWCLPPIAGQLGFAFRNDLDKALSTKVKGKHGEQSYTLPKLGVICNPFTSVP